MPILLLGPRGISASCNQIPGTSNFFRGVRGSLDRPFAGPGDRVEITLSPACDAASPGFAADRQHVVSVVFTPQSGRRHVVVVAPDCAAFAAERQRCAALSDAPGFTCIASPAGIVRESENKLRFEFPDTDSLLDAVADDRTLSGPAAIAVTRVGETLPCDLGQVACRNHPELAACLDTLFTIDGTCGRSADTTFGHFTALPPANDYQALCTNPIPPCTGRATEFRFTTDADGNILIPMDWRGILVGQSVPIARLLRTTFAPEAFPGGGEPIHLPSNAFLHSYSPQGGLLPPIFEPQTDARAQNELVLFGSADAPATVLRVARRSPRFKECSDGPSAGRACTEDAECGDATCGIAHCDDSGQAECRSDADCAEGHCGRPLFEFASRARDGVGPVVFPRFGGGVCQNSGARCTDDSTCGGSRCVAYRTEAKDPVPLEGLMESDSALASVVPEALDGRDLNGDGDATDDVLLLADRKSGASMAIGESGFQGLAATRLRQPPFSYPALLADGDIVVFLEAEPLQGDRDRNGDGDRFDAFLRVYRTDTEPVQEITLGRALAVDAAPMLNGGSFVVTRNRFVFFRQPESAAAPKRITRASIDSHGVPANADAGHPSLSKDGRHVAFESTASNLVADGVGPSQPTSYVHDLSAGRTMRVEFPEAMVPAGEAAQSPWISGEGRYVAVSAPGVSGKRQILLYDRDANGNGVFDEVDDAMPAVISLAAAPPNRGPAGEGDSTFPSISPDGRFVAFSTLAISLDDGGIPAFHGGVIRTDRAPREPVDRSTWNLLATLGGARSQSEVGAHHVPLQATALSADGRYLAFASFDRNLPYRDLNDYCFNLGITGANGITCADILLRDMEKEVTTLESVSSSGEQGNNQSLTPALSANGRVLVFESSANNLVGGDTNSAFDVFLRDLDSGTTSRVSVASNGQQGDAASFGQSLSISDDGRFVAFASRATNLVAGDTNDTCRATDGQPENCSDVFLHDQLTGFTERVSVGVGGVQGDGRSAYPSLSGDGMTVAFESNASTLVAEPSDCGSRACTAVLVSAPEAASAYDLNGDGDVDDTMLALIDTWRPDLGIQMLAPSREVSLGGDRVAFLVPEQARATDLNGDGDADDAVVHAYTPEGVINLGRSAVEISVSEHILAVRTSERSEGNVDLNADGDTEDAVVGVYDFESSTWKNLGQAAEVVVATSRNVIFNSSESSQSADLNLDGDRGDRVLGWYSTLRGTVQSTRQAAEEFVATDEIVAFRGSEAGQSSTDLNGDADTLDFVLQVLDLEAGVLSNTGQAAIPCRLTACDPHQPYRVDGRVIKFLTLEAEQGEDLNGDGDTSDLVLQNYNADFASRLSRSQAGGRRSRTHRRAERLEAGALTTIGAVSAGICSDSGRACAATAECGAKGRCFVPPGTCIEATLAACDSILGSGCGEGAFCVPTLVPGKGACHIRRGSCERDADCAAPARCDDAGQSVRQLVAPLARNRPGQPVFIAACDPENLDCEGPLLVAAAGDADADGIADPFDNCARLANPDQGDDNANGVGDVCEPTPVPATATPSVTVPPPTFTPVASLSATSRPDRGSGDGCRLNGEGRVSDGLWIPTAMLVVAQLFHRRRRAGRPGREPGVVAAPHPSHRGRP